jgi:Amidase
MSDKITRRDALKLGTSVAVSAAASPLLPSPIAKFGAGAERSPALFPLYGRPNSPDEICFMRAVDILDAIRKKRLSAREVMQAHLKQIDHVNAKVNAIVTLVPEDQLMAQAAAADDALARGKWLGPLHGLPVGVKDLHETNGIRTTFGSPLHKDYVPDFDCRVVQHERVTCWSFHNVLHKAIAAETLPLKRSQTVAARVPSNSNDRDFVNI